MEYPATFMKQWVSKLIKVWKQAMNYFTAVLFNELKFLSAAAALWSATLSMFSCLSQIMSAKVSLKSLEMKQPRKREPRHSAKLVPVLRCSASDWMFHN